MVVNLESIHHILKARGWIVTVDLPGIALLRNGAGEAGSGGRRGMARRAVVGSERMDRAVGPRRE